MYLKKGIRRANKALNQSRSPFLFKVALVDGFASRKIPALFLRSSSWRMDRVASLERYFLSQCQRSRFDEKEAERSEPHSEKHVQSDRWRMMTGSSRNRGRFRVDPEVLAFSLPETPRQSVVVLHVLGELRSGSLFWGGRNMSSESPSLPKSSVRHFAWHSRYSASVSTKTRERERALHAQRRGSVVVSP